MSTPSNASTGLLTIFIFLAVTVSTGYGDGLETRGTIDDKVSGDFAALAFSPDGSTLASAFRGKIRLHDIGRSKVLTEIDAHRADKLRG